MAQFVPFDQLSENILRGLHNFQTHPFKLALSNTAPTAGASLFNILDTPAPAAANGYVSNGAALQNVQLNQVSDTGVVTCDPVTFEASGGDIGPFRYAILYNDVNSRLVSYYDFGAAQTIADGGSYTLKTTGQTYLRVVRVQPQP